MENKQAQINAFETVYEKCLQGVHRCRTGRRYDWWSSAVAVTPVGAITSDAAGHTCHAVSAGIINSLNGKLFYDTNEIIYTENQEESMLKFL